VRRATRACFGRKCPHCESPHRLWIRFQVRRRRRLIGRHAVHTKLAHPDWLLANRLLGTFLALVFGPWVARHLGRGRYGVLAFAIALLAIRHAASDSDSRQSSCATPAKALRDLGTDLSHDGSGDCGIYGALMTITNDRSSSMTQRSFFVNSAWLIADKVVRLCLGLLVWVWLARYFGPATFGVWNYAMAFAALFGAVTSLGLDGIVVRELTQDNADAGAILGTVLGMRLAAAVVAAAAAIGVAASSHAGEWLPVLLIALNCVVFILQSSQVLDFHFQARMRARPAVGGEQRCLPVYYPCPAGAAGTARAH
jgi:hypothetical protein